MTSQSNSSQGCGHDCLPNWNPKNGGMLISQPISSCLTNHNELCMSRLLNNQQRRISIYRLQRRPSFGFESSVSSIMMTSSDPVLFIVSLWFVHYIFYDLFTFVFVLFGAILPLTVACFLVIDNDVCVDWTCTHQLLLVSFFYPVKVCNKSAAGFRLFCDLLTTENDVISEKET